MISTRDLSQLPDIEGLRRTLQAMALLDAVLCPEWKLRYYSFNAGWAAGEQMGSMRSGSGDDMFVHFGSAGCWIKGFGHEAEMSSYREDPPRVWTGVLDAVPAAFADCLGEPAFAVINTTFCVWRRPGDPAWQRGPVVFPPGHPDPDGSAWLLSPLDGRPETYLAFAADYHGVEIDPAAVRHVYDHRPLTAALVARLNPEASLRELAADIEEIGYPAAP